MRRHAACLVTQRHHAPNMYGHHKSVPSVQPRVCPLTALAAPHPPAPGVRGRRVSCCGGRRHDEQPALAAGSSRLCRPPSGGRCTACPSASRTTSTWRASPLPPPARPSATARRPARPSCSSSSQRVGQNPKATPTSLAFAGCNISVSDPKLHGLSRAPFALLREGVLTGT